MHSGASCGMGCVTRRKKQLTQRHGGTEVKKIQERQNDGWQNHEILINLPSIIFPYIFCLSLSASVPL